MLKGLQRPWCYSRTMVTNYLHALTHMLDFTVRMTRRAYWYFLLMVLALSCLAISVDSAVLLSALTDGTPEIKIGTMTMTFGALHALPIFAASVRRLHDVGKSGSWMLLNLVPFVGSLVLFSWYARPSVIDSVHGEAPRDRLSRPNWADRTQF
ncbi:MAG: DUF805 domain-containing protein [Hyphomonadaceae bacterium]